MAGGQLGIIIATTAIIFAYLIARVWTRVIRPEVYGAPDSGRTATRKAEGGNRAEQGRPSVTNNVIAHDGGSPTP